MSGPTSVPGSRGSPIGTLSYAAASRLDDLVRDRLVDDEPAQCRAALACRPDGGEENATNDEVDVGARRDDRRVVAAELEQRAAEPGGDTRCQLLAHLRRARGGDERDPRVVRELNGAVGTTDHELCEPFGGAAEPLDRPVEQRRCTRSR